MAVDRPNKRYAEATLRKMLEPVLDFLETSDITQGFDVGQLLEGFNANRTWAIELNATRKAVQETFQLFESEQQTGKAGDKPLPKVRAAHKKVLNKASRTERKAAVQLIKAAGYTDNSYGWSLITDLCRLGHLNRSADGYLLTESGEALIRPRAS